MGPVHMNELNWNVGAATPEHAAAALADRVLTWLTHA